MITVDNELKAALASSRRLLDYTLAHAVPVSTATVSVISKALTGEKDGEINPALYEQFWVAYRDLSETCKPITAAQLDPANLQRTQREFRFYRFLAFLLLLVLLPLSILTYIANATLQDIHQRILRVCSREVDLNCITQGSFSAAEAQNIKNSYDVGGVVVWSYFRLRWLNSLTLNWADPNRIENIWQKSWPSGAFNKLLYLFSDIGSRTQLIYGTLGAYVLPMLYSLMGAVVFRLRALSGFTEISDFSMLSGCVRVVLALVVGAIIGIFTDFTKGFALSALAIGFVAGYSVEVFFSFLDSIVESLRRHETPTRVR
jgi:hypothetical protein